MAGQNSRLSFLRMIHLRGAGLEDDATACRTVDSLAGELEAAGLWEWGVCSWWPTCRAQSAKSGCS